MLEVKHVYTRYGEVECLKGVSLTVNRGEIVALLGANGAGKTTVLKAISGLVKPAAGDILLDGRSLTKMSPEEIVRLGISHVPEGRKIFQKMTVLENLELGAYTRGNRAEARRILDHCFDLFPILQKRVKQKAGTLSGGEQQMLALGRSLMSSPSILLLDEPSLGLAPIFVANIFKMIEAIHGEGKTILLVEQNAHMALKIASRAYVLETGQMVLEGTSDAIRSDPAMREAYLGGP